MIGRRTHSNPPEEEWRIDRPDDVRKLQIIYSHPNLGEGICFIEHVSGQIEVYEVDRFLLEHVLEHLEHRET